LIHYHGTPVSGPAHDKHRFLKGRHALVSFAYPVDLAVVAEVCQSFILDNGAFTVWKKGGKLDEDAYYDWVSAWYKHPGFDWALIPDVIDGTEAENDEMLKRWPSHLANSGVPVWHTNESIDRLRRLCDRYTVVALGSSGEHGQPGSVAWWNMMRQTMTDLCDSAGRPPAKLHGLRMLSPKVFRNLPLSSADSTNASVNAGSKSRFGSYLPVSAWQRAAIIADRVEQYNSAPFYGFKPDDPVDDEGQSVDNSVDSAQYCNPAFGQV
jgi:hypothetical protein